MVKYKTLFRVLQKLVGVLVCTLGVMSAATYLSSMVYIFEFPGIAFTAPATWWTFIPFQGLVGIAVGLYLFFGGKWIADLAIPANRPIATTSLSCSCV